MTSIYLRMYLVLYLSIHAYPKLLALCTYVHAVQVLGLHEVRV